MAIQFNSNYRYRMPVVFGPAVGPRQKPGGGMWAPQECGTMNSEWMAVKYLTDKAKLEKLLPPGFSLRGEPVITVSCAWFKNLYWLAGRGYGILSVDFPVTYVGKTETLEGSFCPVIWEGEPDAIITGREELGFPKLFAKIPEIEWDKTRNTAICHASWFEHTFFDIRLSGMEEDNDSERKLPGAGGGAAMYYKYMPRTSVGGKAASDVAYVTTAAPPSSENKKPDIIDFEGMDFRKWRAKGEIAWHKATFEQLPTTSHIVNAMADLDIFEYRGAEIVTFSGPGIAISVDKMRAVEP